MLIHSVPYALLCVIAPVAWGLMVYWISSWIEKRVAGKANNNPNYESDANEDALPLEYHI